MGILIIEQMLNGIQFGMMLFLISAGLTLVFGVMGVINLAHGSLYMLGAYAAAVVISLTGSFLLAIVVAVLWTALVGVVMEVTVIRAIYGRGHLEQVLATFALTLIFNGLVRQVFGLQPYQIDVPEWLSGVLTVGDFSYPAYRFVFIVTGAFLAVALYFVLSKTKLGMLVRAGSTQPIIVAALGVDLSRLFMLIFALGAILAGIAGALVGPIQAVEAGMGEYVVILAFVVIVIGGVGSVRGAFVAALMVGVIDTLARALLPFVLKSVFNAVTATAIASVFGPAAIYLLMAVVLVVKPAGLLGSKV